MQEKEGFINGLFNYLFNFSFGFYVRELFIKGYTNIEIQPGDTLWDLADEYLENYESKEDYINEVSQLNSIKDGKIISGQNLIMPYYSTEYKL